MSLEEAIRENTAAINSLARLINLAAATENLVSAQGEVARSNAPSTSPAPHVLVSSQPEDDAVPAADTPAADDVTIDYAEVRSAVIKAAATKGKDRVVDLLETFGLKSATEAKPTQYAEIIAACEAL